MLTQYHPNPNLRVGFIGLGNHAMENLLPSILLTPNLKLEVISSRDPHKLDIFAQKFKPKQTTTNWEDVIVPDRVDLVVVSAIPEIHYKVAKKCIEKGVHCFIEKPPVQNINQLQELISLQKDSKVKTFTGYNFTYSDAYNKLKNTLSDHPLKLAKFRFIVGKLNQPVDGFGTVLESCLYKMFIHPMHTLYKTFGPYQTLEILETALDDNKFSMQVFFSFKNGANAVLDWGNCSNRFECRFELINSMSETGVLDNMGNFEFWNLQKHDFDKNTFKSKEKLVFDNSPLLGGFERTGYQREFELFAQAIIDDKPSPCELEDSLEVYRAIEEVLSKSKLTI